MIVWITGQPGSGKTSLGTALAEELNAMHVDGGAIWKMFKVPNNSFMNRCKNVAEAQFLAKTINAAGRNVVVSMVSPYRCQREEFKAEMGSQMVEVHTYADSDPTRPRKEHWFAGYEKPLENCLFLDTVKHDVPACVAQVKRLIGQS